MKLSTADEKAFKGLFYYVKNNLPEVGKNEKYVKAIKKHGDIESAAFVTALKYGQDPSIKVMDLPGQCGQHVCGSEELRVDKGVVEKFQKNSGKSYYRINLQATILHELVHWGNQKFGNLNCATTESEKKAQAFEKEVYGRVRPC